MKQAIGHIHATEIQPDLFFAELHSGEQYDQETYTSKFYVKESTAKRMANKIADKLGWKVTWL